MNRIVLVLACFVLGCAPAPTDDESEQPIVNGGAVGVDPGAEWAVEVRVAVAPGSYAYDECSGVLLNSEWVLTAAHCVSGKQPSQVFVQSTIVQSEGYSGQSFADRIVTYPRYVAGNAPRYDAALVHLSPAIRMPNHVGWRMPLHVGLQIGEWYTCYGYGQTTHAMGYDGTQGALRTETVQVGGWGPYGTVRLPRSATGQVAAPGDSGGPCFATTSRGWALAATASYDTWTNGVIDASYATSLISGSGQIIASWIDTTIGSPSAYF